MKMRNQIDLLHLPTQIRFSNGKKKRVTCRGSKQRPQDRGFSAFPANREGQEVT